MVGDGNGGGRCLHGGEEAGSLPEVEYHACYENGQRRRGLDLLCLKAFSVLENLRNSEVSEHTLKPFQRRHLLGHPEMQSPRMERLPEC